MHCLTIACCLAIGLTIGIGAYAFATFGQRLTLTASGYVPVYVTPYPRNGSDDVIEILLPNAKVGVIGCADTKSAIVPRVLIDDRRSGYVVHEAFQVRRKPLWTAWRWPVSFSCP